MGRAPIRHAVPQVRRHILRVAAAVVIDFHTHIFPPWLRDQRDRYLDKDATFRELYSSPKARMATAEDLLGEMDEKGVAASVVMGIGWADHGLARAVNDYIIESVRRYPDRLAGFAGANPAWGKRAAREAERCAGAGLVGVGELHPDSQGFDLGDRATMAPVMDVVRRHSLIVTTHSSEPVGHVYPGKGETGPDTLLGFIQNYPEARVVCAHWGGGLPFYALMPEVGEALRNVYFDTAASPFLYTSRIFATVARLVGADKILLGSDFPLLSVGRLLEQLDDSVLSDVEKQTIKVANASTLLKL